MFAKARLFWQHSCGKVENKQTNQGWVGEEKGTDREGKREGEWTRLGWMCVCVYVYVFYVCDVQSRLVKINIAYRTCVIWEDVSGRRRTLTEESRSRVERRQRRKGEGRKTREGRRKFPSTPLVHLGKKNTEIQKRGGGKEIKGAEEALRA